MKSQCPERRLALWFVSKPSPVLQRIEFKYGPGCEPVLLDQDEEIRQQSFRWTPVSRAFALLLLDYLIHRNRGTDFIFHESGSARSLAYDFYKQGFLQKVFVRATPGGRPTCLNEALKVDLECAKTTPRAIRFRRAFLPKQCIEVYWARAENEKFGRIAGVGFRELAKRIRASSRRNGIAIEAEQTAGSIEKAGVHFNSKGSLQLLRASVAAQRQPQHLTASAEYATVPKPSHNLPQPHLYFFGHEQLMEETICKLGKNGLIVIHGMGGLGKTSFAGLVAHGALQRKLIPGGAFWIDCSTNPTFEDWLRTSIEFLLGSREADLSAEKCESRLLQYLANSHTLLVFDNFESVIGDASFNQFLRDHASDACIMVTTQEVHDGMRDKLLPFSELEPNDAVEMFMHEARPVVFSDKDQDMARHLCAVVGHLPLAILLLARQVKKTGLKQLESELTNGIALLACNDQFLEPRHRSLATSIQISLDSLDSEDRATLLRFSMAPAGIEKTFAKEYLQSSNWLTSLTRCVNSGLIMLDAWRYRFHPVVRSFLRAQMGNQDIQWEVECVRFFCSQLENAANSTARLDICTKEHENCIWALCIAAEIGLEDYWLLILEMLPVLVQPIPAGQQRTFLPHEQRRTQIVNRLKQEMDKARISGNIAKLERVLVQNLKWSNSIELADWDELRRITEHRAAGLRFSMEALGQFFSGNWKAAEESLLRSVRAWEKTGDAHRGYKNAARINLLMLYFRQSQNREAALVAQTLWQASHSELLVVTHRFFLKRPDLKKDAIEYTQWTDSQTDGSMYRDFPCVDTRANAMSPYCLYAFFLNVGKELHRVAMWAEAACWLSRACHLLSWLEQGKRGASYCQENTPELLEAHYHWGKVGLPQRACKLVALIAAKLVDGRRVHKWHKREGHRWIQSQPEIDTGLEFPLITVDQNNCPSLTGDLE